MASILKFYFHEFVNIDKYNTFSDKDETFLHSGHILCLCSVSKIFNFFIIDFLHILEFQLI